MNYEGEVIEESLKDPDFKNSGAHYVIFSNKVFKIDRTKPEQYQEAKLYGMALGIPAHQLIGSSGTALPTT